MARELVAWLHIEVRVQLPDDDLEADQAFDDLTSAVMMRLASGRYRQRDERGAVTWLVHDGSWTLEDADTREDI